MLEQHQHDTCGHGHDGRGSTHPHDHDHDCEHGHSHSHPHAHDDHEHHAAHGQEVHVHQHGHDHDPSSAHGHSHDHNSDCHANLPEVEETDGWSISLMEHEEALVASLTIELSGNIDSLESLIAASLERLVHQLKDQGALIGHIKAALTCITPVMTFASVGDNLNTKAHQPISYKLEASSIVFNIDKMSLRTLVRNLATHLGTPLSS